MKNNLWIILSIVGVLLLSGCSTENGNSDESIDHSNATHEGIGMEMDMDMEMEEGHMSHTNPLPLNNSTGENELNIPSLLEAEGEEGLVYTVKAQKGSTEFFDGFQTETAGYNGSYLGPVIRVNRGDSVQIKTINDLKEDTTFHWHGLDLPGKGDGGPHQSIKPGESDIVEFTVNQEASTLWFHPHPEGKTAEQVYKGLAGLIYIEDENSKKLGLPTEYGINDIPLVFQNRQFDDKKQLNFKEVKNDDGTIGDTLLVNGTLNPQLTVKQEKVRLRLLNGANARNFNFKLNNGDAFQQIATDGGFLNKPVKLNEITLTPGERAEIIVDFSNYDASQKVALVNEDGVVLLPFNIKEQQTSASDISESLNGFAVSEEERNLPVSKKIELAGMGKSVTINGKKFDMI